MQKQAPSVTRILIMVGFALSCFGLLLFLWLAFGGPIPLQPKGYRFTVPFKEAGQLTQEADVRISGVSVGKVKAIQTDKGTGATDATIQLDSAYAPIPKDTQAILRQKTLLGETYVELTPGSASGGSLPDHGRLPAAQVSPTVELDEIFRAFDQRTRDAFGEWMGQVALATKGRGRDISDALATLGPFAEDTTRLLRILNAQQSDLTGVVRNTGIVFDALSARDDQLRALIDNSDRVFATTAARDAQLQATFRALPTFERESRATIARLTAFAKTTDPLVTQLRPAARQLSPTLQQVQAISPDLRALFIDLGPLIDASVRGLPATEDFLDELHPLLANLDAPLRQLNPALAFLGDYRAELNAFFANVSAATQATAKVGNRDVHYLRTTNPVNPEALAAYPTRLATNRTNPYPFPGAFGQLKTGLASYETRQCTNTPVPTLDTAPNPFIPAPLAANIQTYFFGANGQALGPPCRSQGRFTVGGRTTQFPQIGPATGPTAAVPPSSFGG
jgi:phospholipid/cholesterol/gamma-HCH transport system substrate-binding protein